MGVERLWRNWPVHNLLAHPLSELAFWLARPFGIDRAATIAGAIHDATLPPHESGTGRG